MQLLRRLMKIAAYVAATVVILMAIAVGLFRLFLPRLPEYQDDIKNRASAAIGMQVEFSGMDARWGLSGPELEFYEAELIRPVDGVRVIAAEEVRVGIGFIRLLFDRALIVDRLVIRETTIDVRQLADNTYRIQGIPANELFGNASMQPGQSAAIEIIAEDIELRFMQPSDERPHFFDIPSVRVSVDDKRIKADADVRLPEHLGRQLGISATQVLTSPSQDRNWDLSIDANDILLPGWTDMMPASERFESGAGDLELGVAIGAKGVSSAVAVVDFESVAMAGESDFDIAGRVEVDVSSNGWLLAANGFAIGFDDHEWPESALRFEASVDDEGEILLLDTRASFLQLDDVSILLPWLTIEQREALAEYAPSGVVRDLVATVSEIGSDAPQYNVTAELEEVGVKNSEGRPGVRGFSGAVRANQAGGSLEINAVNMLITAPEYVPEVIELDSASGTVIWRNSDKQITVLSDSIAISNAFFDSQNNVQLVLNKDGSSPVIDLASSWSISDVATAKRFIPQVGVNRKLYDWFQMSMVSGSIPRGTTSLNGPLDKFPFDGGEGRLLVEASVRNMDFKYHDEWPASTEADIEVVVDNARLYSVKNRSNNVGNTVVDAEVNIADLRDPVLTISSFSTGTLRSIRDFSIQSPIDDILGGNLERIDVSGDASFILQLSVPLKRERLQEFEFQTKIRSNNGTIALEGFSPPLTDLIGEVTIERETISSEGLGGRFLGEDVTLSLGRSDDPTFSVAVTAEGSISADGIVNGLGAPLEGLVSGRAPYRTHILFPNRTAESTAPLTVRIDSELIGLASSLPEPAGKVVDAALPISAEIQFPPGGDLIESSGSVAGRMSWQLAFNKPEGDWDLDRGIVTLGDTAVEEAGTRGLHIRGETPLVRFQNWLDLSRSGEKKVGVADRIRSIDVVVGDLFLLGQHLRGHRVKVDRSARDWLVQFDGDDLVGSAFVPYDFGGDRAMVLEMKKLRLPGDEESETSESNFDPRKLPPIQLSVEDFAFGDRYLGAVEANIEKTENGLVTANISSKDATYGISGSGHWLADETDPLGSRSSISAVLTSTNVKETMARLNYQPGIVSKELRIVFDLDWSGGPRADFFNVLDGEVDVRFGNGQLEEVQPGAGRVFGLMSITALPRRLSFDFKDVFNKGFGFDKIAGRFRIQDGVTLTCDLSLEGPAADIGIVGEADLANRTYNQTAVVAANVGNTLPIVGAMVAGPQVAAGLLILSQIFKKPLQEVGQVYYGIGGSWDEPTVEAAKVDAFVASGELAGCLADSE